jgi:hypothetical protein
MIQYSRISAKHPSELSDIVTIVMAAYERDQLKQFGKEPGNALFATSFPTSEPEFQISMIKRCRLNCSVNKASSQWVSSQSFTA